MSAIPERANGPAGGREVPPRLLPVPDTVSAEMQAVIGRPLDPSFNVAPATTAEWKARVDKAAVATVAALPQLREALGVTVEPTRIGGVKAFTVTPRSVPPGNRDRVLVHLHGGVRVLNPGEAGTREAILMAGFAGFRVISVDYRMPPSADHSDQRHTRSVLVQHGADAPQAAGRGRRGGSAGVGRPISRAVHRRHQRTRDSRVPRRGRALLRSALGT